MNFMLLYYVKGYSEQCVRTFYNLDNLIRFIQNNEYIDSFNVYKISKYRLDLEDIL